jgi:hypothetical protein
MSIRIHDYPQAHIALSLALLSGISAVPTAHAADAADADAADRAAEIIVTAVGRESDVLPHRPSSSIYGLDGTVLDTPRSVSQISPDQLLRDPIRTTDDFVKYAPGITRGGGQNVNATPFIRGLKSDIFQNGQRIYVDTLDHPVNFNAFEGADIIAGPSSVIFGPAGGSGGYVNYLAKQPHFDGQHSEVRAEIGTWVPGDKSFSDFGLTLDTGGPIQKDLAYRISIRGKRGGTYYDNIRNNYNSFYGALSYRPSGSVRIDWNGSFDNYYDFNATRGWNRNTQELVSNFGSYYGGRATPIISSPNVGLWSPVFASSSPTSPTLGWQTRTPAGQGRYIAGAVQTTPLPSAAIENAGTILGWVYDPSIPGNGLTQIKASQGSGRREDKNTSKRYISQLRVGVDLSSNWNLLSSSYFQRSVSTTDSVGAFFYQNRSTVLDQRFEIRGKLDFELGGVKVGLQSNSGAAIRHFKYQGLSANNSFNFDPYDLTQDPSLVQSPGRLYGLTQRDPNSSGSWIGTPGVPQLSPYVGYLNIPPMYPVNDGFYAEVGGFPFPSGAGIYTSSGRMTNYSLFTQQNLSIGDHVAINVGGNLTNIRAKIFNPIVIQPGQEASDTGSYWLPSYQASLVVKPTDHSSLYITYDRSEAVNLGIFGSFLIWGFGNTLDSNAFHSVSELYEAGAKVEAIPDKLFLSTAGFIQYRDLSPDQFGNIARVRIKGVEAAVRYEASERLSGGLNFTYLDPIQTYVMPFGYTQQGFFADNATAWGDLGVLNPFPAGRHPLPGLPKTSVNGYVDYKFTKNVGAQAAFWLTGPWYTDLNKTVRIPTEHNVDLHLYYRDEKFDARISVLNITDQKNFLSALTGAGFLQPLAPTSVQATIAYRF